jgi:hypothetical protein
MTPRAVEQGPGWARVGDDSLARAWSSPACALGVLGRVTVRARAIAQPVHLHPAAVRQGDLVVALVAANPEVAAV